MIEFPNLQNASPVTRTATGWHFQTGKKESFEPAVSPVGVTDVVEISADAALKGKLSAFSTALAREMETTGIERMAKLKEKYAGDACPIDSAELARVIYSKMMAEGYANE